LIGHAVAFARLQQIADMLATGSAPHSGVVLKSALRAGDAGLAAAISLCAPISVALKLLAEAALLGYTQGGPARGAAVDAVMAAADPVIDAGGIHSNGAPIVTTADPQHLLDIVCIKRQVLAWTPVTLATTARDFIASIDTALPAIGGLSAALGRVIGHDALRAALICP
jgi:hypothetical protein